jgi:hypothetical protein
VEYVLLFVGGTLKIYICILLIVLMSDIPYVAAAAEVVTAAGAMEMIPTSVVVDELSRAQTQEKIEKILAAPELKTKLAQLGLPPTEISKRLATLSDAELRQMASQMDQARYGGDVTGILIVVVLVLLVIFLIKRI